MDETTINPNQNNTNDTGFQTRNFSSKSNDIQDHWKQTFATIPTETSIDNSEFHKLKTIGKGGFGIIELQEGPMIKRFFVLHIRDLSLNHRSEKMLFWVKIEIFQTKIDYFLDFWAKIIKIYP